MTITNPFPIIPYKSSELFCDREEELAALKNAFYNGRNTILLSLRRIGKTGLIKHLFNDISKTDASVSLVYIDIMDTRSVDEFVNKLATTVMQVVPKRSSRLLNNFVKMLSGLNPILTFDPQTGAPSVELQLHTDTQQRQSVEQIFGFLESQKTHILIAIDEFQQITHYKQTGFEAFLRSQIQNLKNCNFIFSGSEQHILTEMFSSPRRPFYQSADFLKLNRIPTPIYAQFIVDKFAATKKTVDYHTVYEQVAWLDNYTFYVQNYFNKLWYISGKKVILEDILTTNRQVLNERDYIYSNLSKLLTNAQFNVLKAIAICNGVKQPTAYEFIATHNLGTSSTVNSAIKALKEKELVYYENDLYKVYDVFLEKWVQQKAKPA